MALGLGLDSLIPPKNSPANVTNQAQASALTEAQAAVLAVPVTAITVNPQQPRRHFSHQELETLIISIQEYGILQPLLVSQQGDTYELIAGERRLRAARIAGLATVPVIIKDVGELEKLALALIENIQRSDLNAIEKADAYRKLINEFGLNHDEAAHKVGISRSSFTNTLRLLDLPVPVQKALADNHITESHAKILLGLPSQAEQLQALQRIVEQGLSVHALAEQLSGKTKQLHHRIQRRPQLSLAPDVRSWQDTLTTVLATKVTIIPKGDGGTMTIHYFSPAELAALVQKINGSNQ